ncbi:MAG: EAL domain-containing protein [Sulfurimonas sp.]|uniref:bifunctional diguanylate cyclase/phosphodiesterase n=1 Tax=Sulfurimonas sp. TaxID=2022749 RepID=UPI00261BE166|nr:EAL domain-containing protein [Sulfurimonas sp.]MCW8894959.1 EAL domain-containing protein [Sulfurimonas sp.]MCW8954625.1 EAL domain-containing protein [Sulfurimonas sp.]MCW9066885.1 EAL domain-containing protein [Sulfurimonas sp.]
MKVFFPLKYKLMFYTLFFIIASSVTMGLTADGYIHSFFHKDLKDNFKEVFYSISSELKRTEKQVLSDAYFISKNKLIIDSLDTIQNYQKTASSREIDKEKKKLLKIILDKGQENFNDHIAIYNSQHELLAYTDHEEYELFQGFVSYKNKKASYHTKKIGANSPYHLSSAPDHIATKLYKAATLKNNKKILYQHSLNYLNLETTHTIIKENQNKPDEIIGYVKINNNISTKYLNKQVYKENITVDYYFNDSKEERNTPSIFSRFTIIDLPLNEDKYKYFSKASIPLDTQHVVFTATMDKTELYSALLKSRYNLVENILIIVVITVLISLIILNRLLSIPLRRLIKGIDIIADGDYTYRSKIKNNDEFGLISTRFNEMANEIQKREYALDSMVQQDLLTKIPNRYMFNARLEDAISRADRLGTKIAVFFLDIDDFKNVNDTFGHNFGDKLLVQVSSNLVEIMRRNDLLARIGGDEFNVLIEDLNSIVVAEEIAQKILKQLTLPIIIDNHKINITGSIGISIYPHDANNATSLLKNADLAMYHAKDTGRNTYQFFSEELSVSLKNRALMLSELKSALKKGEFDLFYQPKFSLKDGSICSAEALIRWNNKRLGFLSPDAFIPLAEESGEIVSIGAWIIKQACKDFALWKELGLNIKQVSINVSNIQFAKDNVVKVLKRNIKNSGISPSSLEVEITESYIQDNSEEAIKKLHQLRELGIDLAIDDFGTGYSSMSYLKRLPITRLKIDKSFIDDIPHNNDDVKITKIIVALAKVMELSITAEGIETVEQVSFLQELDCDEGQGHICSKALSSHDFVELLKNHTTWMNFFKNS